MRLAGMLGGDAFADWVDLIGEGEGEDGVLVFRRDHGPADGAGGVPDPGFEGFVFDIFVAHGDVAAL